MQIKLTETAERSAFTHKFAVPTLGRAFLIGKGDVSMSGHSRNVVELEVLSEHAVAASYRGWYIGDMV
jgi:hypothetical protein